MNEDLQYLKLLSIFHYIFGGMAALFAFIPIIYVVIGMLAFYIPGPLDFESEGVPAFIGLLLIIFGTGLIVLGWAFSACIIIAGRYLARQVHYMFCMVMAAIECIFMPFGTVLGIFTIVVLVRPSVKEMFERNAVPTSTGALPGGSARA
ncbi:MAG: hypothetical protein A2Y65_03690 [Deltaproteobacteria bacterium RBG_13_52_11]|nr:MAG: hypothetical protein A2Y65_03690 [Deltaproteobacteria bacterium RBG_13_52_11]